MKYVKKISSIVLALIMVLAMGTSVFATDDQKGTLEANGVVKNADHSSVGTTLSIPKGITVYGSLDKVYGPTITYSYTIAPVDPPTNAKIIDFNNVEHIVVAGPTDSASLTDSTAEFTSSELTLSNKSLEITDDIKVSIATGKFTKPGVYRYVITDTTEKRDLFAAGITRPDDYNVTRYLDVYVKYNSDETAFEVYGYVLNDTNLEKIEGTDDQPLAWETPAAKSSGFVASSETSGTGKGTDEYHTIDVNVTKLVTGSMGDKTNEFPFTIDVSNSGLHYYSGEVAQAPTSVSSLTDGASAQITGALKDKEVLYIYGLNPKATVKYAEKNNTADVYNLTVKDSKDNFVNDPDEVKLEKRAIEGNAVLSTKALTVSNYDADNSTTSVKAVIAASDNKAISFTNDLSEISPTNVVMRFAPYLFILGGAMLLLVASRRRKSDQE